MMLVRGVALRAPMVCRRTIGAPSNGPLTRPWLVRNSAILRSLKSLPSLIVVSSHRLTSRTGPKSPLPDRQTLVQYELSDTRAHHRAPRDPGTVVGRTHVTYSRAGL